AQAGFATAAPGCTQYTSVSQAELVRASAIRPAIADVRRCGGRTNNLFAAIAVQPASQYRAHCPAGGIIKKDGARWVRNAVLLRFGRVLDLSDLVVTISSLN